MSKLFRYFASIFFILAAGSGLAESIEKRTQSFLNLSGYDAGPVDGIAGPRTLRSITAAYDAAGLTFDGTLDRTDVAQLRQIYLSEMRRTWRADTVLSRPMDVADARHFLERTGLGANPVEIQKLIGVSRADAIFDLLSGMESGVQTPLPDFIFDTDTEYWIRWDYDEPGRQAFRVARDREISEFRTWWIREMIATTAPQNERLMLFWTDHFPVEYSAIDEEAFSIAKQHLMLREYGFGNFKTLIKNILRDPAMLSYLNGENSNKKSPNENLARELMELFVLGEGTYDEDTVKAAAKALTGKRVNRMKGFEYYLHPRRHDQSVKSLFGQKGRFDGDDLVDILFDQPSASHFLTQKMWSYYVSETEQNQAELDHIAQAFRRSNFEISVLMAELLATPSFWAEQTRGTIVKSPVDLVIGSIRSTGHVPVGWQSTASALANLGQNLFEPPNIAGWTRGAGWVTPANLLNRTKFVADFFSKEGSSIADLAVENPEMMFNQPETILIRYGAENFEGPPKFQVKLQRKKDGKSWAETVWRSDVITAKGGHDTELFGRIERSEIPWMIAEIKTFPDIDFDYVTVEFMNDHCCGSGGSDGGDRNLFIDWVKAGEMLYMAQDGEQISNCKGDQRNPGMLYCSGMVKMSSGMQLRPSSPSGPEIENQLTLERVAFLHGDTYDPQVDWNEISLGLLNLRFNAHQQFGMRINLIAEDNNEIFLEFNASDCSDSCLQGKWPAASHRDRSGNKIIQISLGPREPGQSRQQFEQLSPADKHFVSAIWQALPELLLEMQTGRNFKRRDGAVVLASWEDKFTQIQRRLRNSRYVIRYPVPEVVIAKDHSKKAGGMMSMAMSAIQYTPPVPAANFLAETQQHWERKMGETFSKADMAAAILAIAPISAVPSDQPITLMKDPVYHLK